MRNDPDTVARCTRPPAGWWCSRDAGHDGPCAAHPLDTPSPIDHPRGLIAQLITDAGVPSQRAHQVADEIVAAYAELNAPRPERFDTGDKTELAPPRRDWL